MQPHQPKSKFQPQREEDILRETGNRTEVNKTLTITQRRVEISKIRGHQENPEEKLVLCKPASMPILDSCGRYSGKISKIRSVEVFVGVGSGDKEKGKRRNIK